MLALAPMKVFEHLRFCATGFSPKRVAYLVAALGFVGVPLQFADDWRVGVAACWFGVFVVLASAVFCFMQARGTPKRFHAVALSLIALIAQMLFAHL
jgi:hypothetical protein